MDDGISDRDTSKARQGGMEVAKVNFWPNRGSGEQEALVGTSCILPLTRERGGEGRGRGMYERMERITDIHGSPTCSGLRTVNLRLANSDTFRPTIIANKKASRPMLIANGPTIECKQLA